MRALLADTDCPQPLSCSVRARERQRVGKAIATCPNALDTFGASSIYSAPDEGGVDRPTVWRGRQHSCLRGGSASRRGTSVPGSRPFAAMRCEGFFVFLAVFGSEIPRAMAAVCNGAAGAYLLERTRVGMAVDVCDRCRLDVYR